MLTDKKQILELVSLLQAYGIRHIVLCPGSRNAPLAQTFAACKTFICHAVTDERSAGFVALGLMECNDNQTTPEKGVVVCCTSGSALLNLAPAVAEAHYRQRPLIVVSADRPEAWIGQMDGQTIPQPSFFSRFVNRSVNLPEVKDKLDLWHCNKLINDALIALKMNGGGAVHINVPISEPLYQFVERELPKCRKIETIENLPVSRQLLETTSSLHQLMERLVKSERPMIVVGQLKEEEYKAISLLFGQQRGYVMLCESLSNNRSNAAITLFDKIIGLYHNDSALHPDLVIVLGGHIVSKNLKKMLRTSSPKELWQVSQLEVYPDTYQCVTHLLKLDVSTMVQLIEQYSPQKNTAYVSKWSLYQTRIAQKLEQFVSDDYADFSLLSRVVDSLSAQLVNHSLLHIHLANSSMVRNFQLTRYRSEWTICCNRGVNGIEGTLSTAVGDALANPESYIYCFIGDLSFFYDMNVLGIANLPSNLRIALINNNGGQIFNQLNGLAPSDIRDRYIASQQTLHKSTRGWCIDNRITYLQAENEIEFSTHLPTFTSHDVTENSMLLEIITTTHANDNEQLKLAKWLTNETLRKI